MIYFLCFCAGVCFSCFLLWGIARYRKVKSRRQNNEKIAVAPPIILSAEEQYWMAYHEAGHAVVAVALPEILPVVRVSMIPPPGEEGFGSVRFADDTRRNQTRTSLLHEISVALAGRLAEEICLNKITSSCVHDLQKANSIARVMVETLGMGKNCRFWQLRYNDQKLECSQSMLAASEQDIQKILHEAEDIAKTTILLHKIQIENVARMLLKGKILSGEDLTLILNKGNSYVE